MPSHVTKFIKRSGFLLLDRQKLIALKPRRSDLDRFLSHVDQCERVDLCWNWKHLAMQSKYASFHGWLAHRWIWSLLFGEIPAGHVIHHTCHNPPCVNPVHLKCVSPDEHSRLHRSAEADEGVKMWLDFTRS